MVVIKYGPLATEVSGSIGGVTFARVHDAKAARSWRAPANKRTLAQRTLRVPFALFAAYWRYSLSSAQRAAWNAYALTCTFTNSLGEAYTISGFNMFVRTQQILLAFGPAQNYTAPIGTGFPATPTLTFDLKIGTSTARCTGSSITSAGSYLLWGISHLQHASRAFPSRLMVARGNKQANVALPWDLASPGSVPSPVGDYWITAWWHWLDTDNRISQLAGQTVFSTA